MTDVAIDVRGARLHPRFVRPAVIAHRGASGTRPENTLAAFTRAVALGAHMIELDVQLTLDGEVVVLHDDTLDRTTSGSGPVARRPWPEVAALDAGAWFGPEFAGERVPRLADVLAAVPVGVNVELKPGADDGLERRTLEVVAEAGALRRVVLSSFDPQRLLRLRALSPDADLAVLSAGTRASPPLTLAERVAATALHIRKSRAVPRLVAAAHASGLAVRVWTVNCQEEFSFVTLAGADAVFSDFPERFLLSRV